MVSTYLATALLARFGMEFLVGLTRAEIDTAALRDVLLRAAHIRSASSIGSPEKSSHIGRFNSVQFNIVFDELKGISLGSPVLLRGQVVGSVEQILPQNKLFSVQVSVRSDSGNSLREGTVALLASPLAASIEQPKTVIELISPNENTGGAENQEKLRPGTILSGFSSFEAFWAKVS